MRYPKSSKNEKTCGKDARSGKFHVGAPCHAHRKRTWKLRVCFSMGQDYAWPRGGLRRRIPGDATDSTVSRVAPVGVTAQPGLARRFRLQPVAHELGRLQLVRRCRLRTSSIWEKHAIYR